MFLHVQDQFWLVLTDAVQDHRTPGQRTGHLPPIQDQAHPCQESRCRPRPVPGRWPDPAFHLAILQPHGHHPEKIRWCPSSCQLNAISSLGRLSTHRVDKVLDSLGKGCMISLVDFISSFTQITIYEDTAPLTACSARRADCLRGL